MIRLNVTEFPGDPERQLKSRSFSFDDFINASILKGESRRSIALNESKSKCIARDTTTGVYITRFREKKHQQAGGTWMKRGASVV